MSEAAYGFDRPSNERQAGTGWDMITNPIVMMFMGLQDTSRPDYATTKFDFGRQAGVPGIYDSMGNFYPQQGPGQAGFSFSSGAGGGQVSGTSSAGAGGGATWATPELAPITQGTSTAGLGLSPETLGLSGAGASGSISGASGAGLTKYINAALQGGSALQGAKERKAMSGQQGGETTRTPYQAQMLNPFIPIILHEALNIFKKRQATAGRQAGNFDPLLAMLGQYMTK